MLDLQLPLLFEPLNNLLCIVQLVMLILHEAALRLAFG